MKKYCNGNYVDPVTGRLRSLVIGPATFQSYQTTAGGPSESFSVGEGQLAAQIHKGDPYRFAVWAVGSAEEIAAELKISIEELEIRIKLESPTLKREQLCWWADRKKKSTRMLERSIRASRA